MRKLLFITSALVLILTGCASGPAITVNSAPGADLSNIQTYNFMQHLGTDRENGARTPISMMLISSMSHEMASRGLKQSDSPDILVDFFVTTEARMDVRTTGSSMHSVHRSNWHRGCCTTWPSYRTTVRQYTQGTLIIDLINPSANALLAEGAAGKRLSSNEVSQTQMDDFVSQIMADMMPR